MTIRVASFFVVSLAFWTTTALALGGGDERNHNSQVSAVISPPNVSPPKLCGYYSRDEACPEGCYGATSLDDNDNVTCLETAPGFFSVDYSTNSLPCMSGFFQPYHKSSECYPCPTGTYAPTLSATQCLPCPSSHFQPLQGQSSCLPCDPLFYHGTGAGWATHVDNDTLILFQNDTTVLYCGAPKHPPIALLSTKDSTGASTTTSSPTATSTPSSAPTSTPKAVSGNTGSNNQDPPEARPLSTPVVFAATTLAIVFVASSITVILVKRPGDAKVHPENNAGEDSKHDDSSFPENVLFNAFRSNRGEELPRPPPPPPPVVEAGEFVDVALDDDDDDDDGRVNPFLSPPNHLVPQPPQGPAVVTPWYPGEDEELGYNSEETKESEASFDGFLASYGGNARIIRASPAEEEALEIVKNANIESPLRERRGGAEQDSGDEGYSNYKYQYSPMSGSSQVSDSTSQL